VDEDNLPDVPSFTELMRMLTGVSTQFEEHLERAIAIGWDDIQGEDFLVIAALRRAIDTVKGMVAMAEQENMFCGMPIVRFQIDTAMTLFGRRLVININDYVTHMMQGLERRKHRDRDGEPMTDAYLHRKLTGEYEYTSELYSYSSGFIHFSTHHLHRVLDLDLWRSTGELGLRRHDEILAGWPDEERRGAIVSFLFASQVILSECELWEKDRWSNPTIEQRVNRNTAKS